MAKINELIPEQEADLSATRDKWLAIGLSTAPIDREASKAAVAKMYECAGLPAPNVFIFLDSPRQGAIAAALLKDSKLGDQISAQVWAQVWAQVGAQVWAQVRAQVSDQVRDQVGDQVWAQVGAQVWAQVWAQVSDQVWAQVSDQVGDQVGAAVYGSHDASWMGFYEFFRRHFGLAEKASGLAEITQTCGWVWPFSGAVIITDRPSVIALDGEKRLHCATGPAIEYRDGFAVYAWRGVRIPDDWIGGGLDAKTAVTWPNVEQRRAAIEILGWQNVLSALDAKSLGGNPDPKIGEIIEVQLPFEDDDGNATTRALFLKAQCGTGRTIFEAVDPDEVDLDPRFDPAWCAQAWRDGYSPADWLPPSFRT